MPDGFDTLITGANAFFLRLRDTNTRDFFEAHKAAYTADIKKPADLLAALFAEDLARVTGKAHAPKVFRIHRDVRFSKDKTPYNTHLHLLWSQPGKATTPAWFFGSAPDYLLLGMGVMGLQKDSLQTYRAMVDTHGDALTSAIGASGAGLSDWGPGPLKRVPKPYDPDHPHGELLKRKSFALSQDLPEDWRDTGLLKTLNAMSSAMLPTWSILNDSFPA